MPNPFGGGMMADQNGNVKWPFFITTILCIIALVISLSAAQVSKAEFTQFEKNLDKNMVRLDSTMVRIFKELKSLKK